MREGILRNGISVCVCIIFIVGRDYVRLCRQIIKIFDADDIIFRRTDGLHRAVAPRIGYSPTSSQEAPVNGVLEAKPAWQSMG